MTFQAQVQDAIKEFFYLKCSGTQAYSQIVGKAQLFFNSTTSTIEGFDCNVGWVNEIEVGYSIEYKGQIEFTILNVPFIPEDSFFLDLSEYIRGLVDCNYCDPIEYSQLVKDYCKILSDYGAINQESEYEYDQNLQLQLDNYAMIMAILALPEPTSEDELLQMVQNPLASITEEKGWYSRSDTKRTAKVVKRTKWKRQARILKNMVMNYEPDFPEFDDYAF
jgi:hypothetical protein